MSNSDKTVLFYDGKCQLCSKEIQMYVNKDKHNKLKLVDISTDSFDPTKYELDPDLVQREFHVAKNGEMLIGVDAFVAIWETLGFKVMTKIGKNPIANTLLKAGYRIFVVARLWFPKSAESCKINYAKQIAEKQS